jgi:hypothetical protein
VRAIFYREDAFFKKPIAALQKFPREAVGRFGQINSGDSAHEIHQMIKGKLLALTPVARAVPLRAADSKSDL